MATSGNGRCHQRAKSFDSYFKKRSPSSNGTFTDIETALSGETGGNRVDELSQIPRGLDDGSENVASLQQKIMSLEQKAEGLESQLQDIDFSIFLRELLTNSSFVRFNDKGLMREAVRQFPKEFTCENHKNSYRVMIAILRERISKSMDNVQYRKLDCLRDVAIHFRWSNMNDRESFTDKAFGEQFFIVCVKVSEWNGDLFHPELKGPRMEEFIERAKLTKIRHAIEVLHRGRLS